MNIVMRAGITALSLWAVGACIVAAGQEPPDQPSGGLQATTHLHPGGIVRMTVRPTRPLASIEGEALGRPVRFWPAANTELWHGLLGVGLETTPGSYEATIRMTGIDGESALNRVPVVVEPKQYDVRSIQVANRFANPSETERARIVRERELLDLVLAQAHPERLWRGPFLLPVPGTTTSSFGRLTMLNGRPGGRHQGADFRAASGTPILAPNTGRVVLAADLFLSGNTVILDHGQDLFSVFAHLSEMAVEVGSVAPRGSVLGRAGATGRVTGPHLHWAVRLGGISVDPQALVDAVADLDEAWAEPDGR